MSPAGILPTPLVTRFDYRSAMFHAATYTNSTSTATTGATTTTTTTTTTTHDNNKQKVRVLIATDGIFDVMTNEEAIEILCNQLDGNKNNLHSSSSSSSSSLSVPVASSLEDACLHLVMQARKKWQNDLLLDVRVDDATVVVLEFDV